MSWSSLSGTTLSNRWTLNEPIGQGEDGQVFRALDVNREYEIVAVKVFDQPNQAHIEVEMMQRMSGHQGFVRLLDHGFDATAKIDFLVMPLLGKNLRELKRDFEAFLPATLVKIALQLIQRLKALKAQNIGHKDLTDKNFCLDESGIVTVIDFSRSIDLNDNGNSDCEGVADTLKEVGGESILRIGQFCTYARGLPSFEIPNLNPWEITISKLLDALDNQEETFMLRPIVTKKNLSKVKVACGQIIVNVSISECKTVAELIKRTEDIIGEREHPKLSIDHKQLDSSSTLDTYDCSSIFHLFYRLDGGGRKKIQFMDLSANSMNVFATAIRSLLPSTSVVLNIPAASISSLSSSSASSAASSSTSSSLASSVSSSPLSSSSSASLDLSSSSSYALPSPPKRAHLAIGDDFLSRP